MSDKALHEEGAATLTRLKERHKELKKELEKAPAFAVFPSMGRASLVLGGAYGRGEVYEHGKPIGFARLTQMTLGVQVGGQTFSEVVIFKDRKSFKGFKEGKVTWNANASAVLVKAGGSGTINVDGLVAHAYSQGGLLLEMSLGGQKLTFVPPQKNAGKGADEQQAEQDGDESRHGLFGRKKEEEEEPKRGLFGRKKGGEEEDGEEKRGLFGRKRGEEEENEEEPTRGLFGRKRGEEEENEEEPKHGLFGRKRGEEEQEEEDGEESGERQSARDFVSRHPVAVAVLGPGLSFATTLLARRMLSGGEAGGEQEEARQ